MEISTTQLDELSRDHLLRLFKMPLRSVEELTEVAGVEYWHLRSFIGREKLYGKSSNWMSILETYANPATEISDEDGGADEADFATRRSNEARALIVLLSVFKDAFAAALAATDESTGDFETFPVQMVSHLMPSILKDSPYGGPLNSVASRVIADFAERSNSWVNQELTEQKTEAKPLRDHKARKDYAEARLGFFLEGKTVQPEEFKVDWNASAASKGGWSSFMAKEIADQPQAVADTLMGRLNSDGSVRLTETDGLSHEDIKNLERIIIVACGTAAYAGDIAKYGIEKWSRIPVQVELSHEFRYRDPIITKNTLIVAISQSGETMDTLMAIRYAKELGAKVLAICNTQGATLARESDAVIYTHAGPEVAVASTKALTAQITAGYLLGLFLASIRGAVPAAELKRVGLDLLKMPGRVSQVIAGLEQAQRLGTAMVDAKSVLFLGRNVGFPVAMEGALKLKELAYIHAEGFAAGELKHGPIALIEKGQVVIVIVPSPRDEDSLHPKVISNIQEIRARGAKIIAIAEEGDNQVANYAENVIYVPECESLLAPILTVIPLQAFALALSTAQGLDVDQPRNLAKSVTVE
jgi:glucosamine--fructose-6-phosphate aminotransferase (isomerizing)